MAYLDGSRSRSRIRLRRSCPLSSKKAAHIGWLDRRAARPSRLVARSQRAQVPPPKQQVIRGRKRDYQWRRRGKGTGTAPRRSDTTIRLNQPKQLKAIHLSSRSTERQLDTCRGRQWASEQGRAS